MEEDSKKYQRLIIHPGFVTQVELGGKPLDYNEHYDIKIPNGRIFENCEVYNMDIHFTDEICQTLFEGFRLRNLRINSEGTCPEIIPFFKNDGLEARLKTDFLMRINPTIQEYMAKVSFSL